jgi:hypothetical protein
MKELRVTAGSEGLSSGVQWNGFKLVKWPALELSITPPISLEGHVAHHR